jgi:hypothetical protein
VGKKEGSMDIGVFVALLVTLGSVFILLGVSYFILKERRRAWDELASQTGLSFEPGSFWGRTMSLTGTFRGRPLKLDTFRVQMGRNSVLFTRIRVKIENRNGVRLSLRKEGLGSKLGKLLGASDIQTGDDELDRRYMIKGQPQDFVVRLLSIVNLRQKILASSINAINVDEAGVSYEKRGFQANLEGLLAMFGLLSDLADAVERME